MKIAISCDHIGYRLKEEVKKFLEHQGHEILDFGADENEASSDLFDYIYPAAIAVSKMKADHGIFIDATGYSSALIVNRISHLYAVACQGSFCAQRARAHANANVLCLGSEIVGASMALEVVNTWVTTEFSNNEKDKTYVESIVRLSENHLKPLFRCEVEEYEAQVDKVVAQSEQRKEAEIIR